MADPTTANQLLAVPTRGSDPGTWDLPVNGNTTALDGLFGGMQGISVTNTPITLTAPAGVVTASAGPTQAQNAILNFTGTLTGNVQVTLPLPGYYIIRNGTVPGNFVLSFRAVNSGAIIGFPPGQIQHVFNDGTNCFFANLGNVGEVETWSGLSAVPSWVAACTTPPYLLCDGTVFTISTYPIIGARYGSLFGGNGITTAATPDLRGRVPLIYDGTGTRITVAGCGINGQTLGASQDKQTNNLAVNQIPPGVTSSMAGTAQPRAPNTGYQVPMVNANVGSIGYAITGGTVSIPDAIPSASWTSDTALAVTGTATSTNGAQVAVNNVQPGQVTGIAVVRAG